MLESRFAAFTLSSLLLLGATTPATAGEDAFRYFAEDTLYANVFGFESAGASFQQLKSFVGKLQDPGKDELGNALAKSREDLGVDIETELLPLFVGDLAFGVNIAMQDVMALAMAGDDPTNPAVQDSIYKVLLVVGCRSESGLDGVMKKVADKRGDTLLAIDLDGTKGWKYVTKTAKEGAPTLHWVHHEGRMLMGLSPRALTGALGRHGSGRHLLASDDYKKVRAHVPKTAESLTYINLPDLAAQLRAAAMFVPQGDDEVRGAIDLFLDENAAPFGVLTATSRAGDGQVRTTYGPDSMLAQLGSQLIGQSLPMLSVWAGPGMLLGMSSAMEDHDGNAGDHGARHHDRRSGDHH
ncbi:MAG: hypothetical protein AAF533_28450 [Acidobacteriota bacterium]